MSAAVTIDVAARFSLPLGEAENEDDFDPALEARLKRTTRVRGLYQAAWRALGFVHRYRAECCARREAWREDKRIVACLEQVAADRASIRVIRAEGVS